MDFRAPDFSSQPINNQTVQGLTIPAYADGYLSARGTAAWEQAVVVYFDGQRSPTLLGNYGHAGIHWFGQAPHARQVLLAGWHKRSGPDGGQPWNASRGQTSGRICRWDDSGGDLDYNDVTVELIVFQHIGTQEGTGTTTSPLVSAGDVARMAVALASLDAAGRNLAGEAKETLHDYVQRATCVLTRRYVEAHREVPTWPPPVTASVVLAAELERVAQTFAPGSIRTRLEETGRRLLADDAAAEPRARAAGTVS